MTPADIASASTLLANRDYLSFAWITSELEVEAVLGLLSNELKPGDNICRAIPALFGFEDRVRELQHDLNQTLELPNVRTFGPCGASQRLNYMLQWCAASRRLLLSAARPLAIDETVIELQREARRRRLAEEQLLRQAEDINEANKALSEANAGLSEFTRIISHDLKAPMRAMRYLAEDLEGALLSAPNSDALAHIDRLKAQSRRMSAMITGLLQYSRLGNEVADAMTGAGVDIEQLVYEIAASLPRPAGIQIMVDAQVSHVRANRELLDLVLRNLIENAIKHHDREDGLIEVSTRNGRDEDHLIVADDGPGIPRDLQDAVFRPFTQLDPEAEGTGLGLTLVLRAAEVSGAALTVVSDPEQGRGSKFILRLPDKNKSE